MADLKLDNTSKKVAGQLIIVGSKSLSNRLLILQKLHQNLEIKNLANAHDTQVLIKALASKKNIIDVGHAGTAMRFLTAYYAAQEGVEIVLTGSSRMQERPIAILVDALRELGADISYQKREGYPPLLIKGKKIIKSKVQIDGSVSSQYISALLLIAPSLEKGLIIELIGKITSIPYINMTLSLLKEIGVSYTFNNNIININYLPNTLSKTIVVESDWSAVSYFYSLVALSKNGVLELKSFKKESLQGDKVLIDIYEKLGVKTVFEDNTLFLSKGKLLVDHLFLDLKDAPDIAQTIAVTCFGLGVSCDLSGLHTLKIKETDRLVALKIELEKLGAKVKITADSLRLEKATHINKGITIATYQDHRMAMAFAPLSLLVVMSVKTFDVVKKSYPNFWMDFDTVLKS